MKKCLPLVVLAFCLLPGCASIVSGTHQEIKISSEPAGATVIIGWEEEKDNVKTMAGRTVAAGVTPVTVSISRRDGMIEVVKEGYKAQTVKLERGFNYWFLGNVALTSPLSSMIDSTTGALNEYKPGEYMVKLEPVSK
ncbi:MAG: hypothetical protein CSYNP_00299 [Syntrophus sp. SKADARSKE-3]|nr:hypothetical protein [Syntrophus sp. SKADARSKE-3]